MAFPEELRKRRGEKKKDNDEKKGNDEKKSAPAADFGESQIKPVADAADAILSEAGLAEAEGAVAGPVGGAEGAENASSPDVAPLVDQLGIDEARARAILQAAKKFPETKALDAAALANALGEDIKLRMKVETEAARIQDAEAGAEAEEGMEAPPAELGGPMGGGMLGGPAPEGGQPPVMGMM